MCLSFSSYLILKFLKKKPVNISMTNAKINRIDFDTLEEYTDFLFCEFRMSRVEDAQDSGLRRRGQNPVAGGQHERVDSFDENRDTSSHF